MDEPSAAVRTGYTPVNPSQLRESHCPPPSPSATGRDISQSQGQSEFLSNSNDRNHNHSVSSSEEDEEAVIGEYLRHRRRRLSHRNWDAESGCGRQNCKHGTYSPHTGTPAGYSVPGTPPWDNGFGFPYNSNRRNEGGAGQDQHRILGEAISDGLFRSKMKRKAGWLPITYGLRHPWFTYLEYYIPLLRWIRQYKWSFVMGDLIAALTMASFYIPMSLSLAANLAHVPAINGLYAFAINPLIYALLGTCPQMVIGPEAAGSLLTGNVVKDSITKGQTGDDDVFVHAQIAGIVTGVAGAILLLAGGARLGFLDNVLSRPFLRGFISAVGVVIFVDQLIPEMGLSRLAAETGGISHGSCITKAIFLVKHVHSSHGLTCAVSFGALAIIMVCREIKRRLQARYPKAAYMPDRFLIVVIATVLCWKLRWSEKGLAILGDARSTTGKPFPVQFPMQFSHLKHIDTALSTAFVIALLGFFESSVAAKSLGSGPSDGIQNMNLSANRELVALGTANVVGSIFMALPAFGGYGRSKVNASTGGKTPMSSVFLSLITIICIYSLLPVFYYIPKGVLSAMISVVAYSLVEEAPHDLRFFWNIRGWSELFLIFIVFAATIFYSLSVGIACGIGFSILRVIKHATRPRIQILGRVRGTIDQFENAEANPDRSEFIKGCLIVKIPEPLTFANTGDLRHRLQKLIDYGTILAHPALPRVTSSDNNKNIIFDVHGVTSMDGAGAQVLSEILEAYQKRGTRLFFCRVPSPRSKVYKLFESSGIIKTCGGPRHFVSSVQEALRMTELESLTEEFRDHPEGTV